MRGYWFNFNRGYIAPTGTTKLNCRYVGIPEKIKKISAIFGKTYKLFFNDKVILAKFNSNFTLWHKTDVTKVKFNKKYSLWFIPVNKPKVKFNKKYETNWRGDNG